MKSPNKNRVVVAMSGGVDSSVAAALLCEQGYEVVGMMLRLWSEPGSESFNRCCTPESMDLARRVARHLGIPFYVMDVRKPFENNIVKYFIEGYSHGVTPNPCMMCNRHMRFGTLLKRALSVGADFLATGHYAQLQQAAQGKIKLLRGIDSHKDQSYVLSVLSQDQLSRALFPIGKYSKHEVRKLARDFDLPVADRPDSQDLCFLAGGDYRNFLQRHAPHIASPGPIVNLMGSILGEHQGLPFYTIGQRKGLGISAPQPLYVIEKDTENNTLIVGIKEELGACELIARDTNWVSIEPPYVPIRAQVKIRYQAKETPATIHPLDGGRVRIVFDHYLRDITPGQSAVFYDGDFVLGNGIIVSSGRDQPTQKEFCYIPISTI